MKIQLYQISPEKDKNNLLFRNYDFAVKYGDIDYDSYELVFEGEVEAKRLDDIYTIFNLHHPEEYKGRSMSVSDIVYAEGLGTFFCDSYGFKPVEHPKEGDAE
jgi:hypothetical protein